MLRTAAISPADLSYFVFCRIWSMRVRNFYLIKWTAYQVLTSPNSSALLLILGNANIVPPQDQYPLCWSDCADHMISSHPGIYFHEMPAKYPCLKKNLKLSYLEFFLVLTVRVRSATVKQSLVQQRDMKINNTLNLVSMLQSCNNFLPKFLKALYSLERQQKPHCWRQVLGHPLSCLELAGKQEMPYANTALCMLLGRN